MISPGLALRLVSINLVLVKHGLDEIVLATHLFRPVRYLRYISPWRWRRRANIPRGVRIRKALEELGPVFVKFGQIISTRRDLLPEDIADELARLQDKVPPFPGTKAREIIESGYGRTIEEAFLEFDEEPIASASIAQVHCARLHDNSDVVIKVVRPDIKKAIQRDVALLYALADLAERYWRDGRRLRPREVVVEYEKTILDELDMMREAANAAQLRRNFQNSEMLYVPKVYWEYINKDVMVMERVYGVPISDIAGLKNNNIDLKRLSENGVEIFFTQVFRDNFFHADMHPGNIFVSPEGKYVAVDFGIIGTLSPEDQRYLVENFLAFFNRDYRRVAELHVESEWVPEGTRVDEFESAIRTVCEPIFERPLREISFGRLLLHLFQTARRFNMEVQPQLVLLQKTLINVEGLGRQLYPDLDLWKTAKPFLERWMDEQIGIKSIIRTVKKSGPAWLEKLPRIPDLIEATLNRANEGKLNLKLESGDLKKIHKEIRDSSRRTFGAIVAAALIIGAAVIKGLDGTFPVSIGNAPLISWILGGAGALLLFSIWPESKD